MQLTSLSRCGAIVLAVAAFLIAPAAAMATDYTWAGTAPSGTPGWMTNANWQGGTAPSGGSVGNPVCPADLDHRRR